MVVRTLLSSARAREIRHSIDMGYISPSHRSAGVKMLLTDEKMSFSIIREALGLTKHANAGGYPQGNVTKNVILDAEMVAFSDRLNRIDGACSVCHNCAASLLSFFSRVLENTKSHYQYGARCP
jgi:hypothetical protein